MGDDGLTATTEWYLKVSPAGYGSNNDGFLSVYLFRGGAAETSSSLKTEVELSVGHLKKAFVRKCSPGNGYGFKRFMSHKDMASQLIGAGTLVIRCEVTIHPRKSCRGYILPPQASLKGSGTKNPTCLLSHSGSGSNSKSRASKKYLFSCPNKYYICMQRRT